MEKGKAGAEVLGRETRSERRPNIQSHRPTFPFYSKPRRKPTRKPDPRGPKR